MSAEAKTTMPGSISLNSRVQQESNWKERCDMAERWDKRYQKVPSRGNPFSHRPLGTIKTSCTAPMGTVLGSHPTTSPTGAQGVGGCRGIKPPTPKPAKPPTFNATYAQSHPAPKPAAGGEARARSTRRHGAPARPEDVDWEPPRATPAEPEEDGASSVVGSVSERSPSELSHISHSTLPSTIRSSQPSTIARKKLAELQMRLQVERVKRLELENELENEKRMELLQREGK